MKLYLQYMKIQIQSIMEHKMSFFLTLIGQVILTVTAFLGIYFMFLRFHSVKGFTYQEVLLGYSVVLFSFSMSELFARGFDTFASMVSRGEFDRIMVRPRNEIFQVLASKMEFTRIGKLVQALFMLLYVILKSGIVWTPYKIYVLVSMAVGELSPLILRDIKEK